MRFDKPNSALIWSTDYMRKLYWRLFGCPVGRPNTRLRLALTSLRHHTAPRTDYSTKPPPSSLLCHTPICFSMASRVTVNHLMEELRRRGLSIYDNKNALLKRYRANGVSWKG